ncbi:hypothetical protein EYF80_031219 [Liparis tanakae]|uniref:Uncharacterized protein n=1 Tax=Liparis tanakae TaxID=230148 RepID=A0A4Z2GYR5_9TELE|nr:hypothetical protein EYF80_031219 [Liparis tanakae]
MGKGGRQHVLVNIVNNFRSHLFLFLLAVVVAHHRFGPGAAAPPPLSFPSSIPLFLPAQPDLHLHRASCRDGENRGHTHAANEPPGATVSSEGHFSPLPPPLTRCSHSDSEPSSRSSSSSSLSSPSLSSSFSIFCRTLVKTDCSTMESS